MAWHISCIAKLILVLLPIIFIYNMSEQIWTSIPQKRKKDIYVLNYFHVIPGVEALWFFCFPHVK